MLIHVTRIELHKVRSNRCSNPVRFRDGWELPLEIGSKLDCIVERLVMLANYIGARLAAVANTHKFIAEPLFSGAQRFVIVLALLFGVNRWL